MFLLLFSGSEWDFVILSTVRSLPRIEIEAKPTYGWKKRRLGFTADEHLMNVALTRARRGLIIIGGLIHKPNTQHTPTPRHTKSNNVRRFVKWK